MILLGSSDPGAIKYFLSFYKKLRIPVAFTSSGSSSNFLKKKMLNL